MGLRRENEMGKKCHLITIWTDPNAPLDYALGTEHYHPIMSTLEGHGDRLERDRCKILTIYIIFHSIS